MIGAVRVFSLLLVVALRVPDDLASFCHRLPRETLLFLAKTLTDRSFDRGTALRIDGRPQDLRCHLRPSSRRHVRALPAVRRR